MTSHSAMQPLGTIKLSVSKENLPQQGINPNAVCGLASNYLHQILESKLQFFNFRKVNQDKDISCFKHYKEDKDTDLDSFLNTSSPVPQFSPGSPQSTNIYSPSALSSPLILDSFSKIVDLNEDDNLPPLSSSSNSLKLSFPSPFPSPLLSSPTKNSSNNFTPSKIGKRDRPMVTSGQRKKLKCVDETETEDDEELEISNDELEYNPSQEVDNDVEEIEDDNIDVRSPLKEVRMKRKYTKRKERKRKYNKSMQIEDDDEDKENTENEKATKKRKYRKKDKAESETELKKKKQRENRKEEEQSDKKITKQDPNNGLPTPAGKVRVKHYMKKRDNGSEPWIHQTQLNPPILGKMRQGILCFPEGVKDDLTVTFSTKRLQADSGSNIFWTQQDRLGRRHKETFSSKNKNTLVVNVTQTSEPYFLEAFLHTARDNTTSKPQFEVSIKVKNNNTKEEIVLSHFTTAIHSHKYESSSSGKKSDLSQGVQMDVVKFI